MKKPRIAYILLWFPKPSETFIFREVTNLWQLGLKVSVYTLYGSLQSHLSKEMLSVSDKINRLGIPAIKRIVLDSFYWLRKEPQLTRRLFRTIPFRRWRSLEVAGENIWAFLAGFTLARYFMRENIQHIHAPWANGPATAAWVASQLTKIPFSFTGRAVDIYPPDGALEDKIRDCSFVRTNTKTNKEYLKKFLPEKATPPIYLTYNGYPLNRFETAPVLMRPPYQILGVGRFARFKGFATLLKAAGHLNRRGVDFQLILVGDGWRRPFFSLLCRRLGILKRVTFTGFVSHDHISQLYHRADLFVMPSEIHRSGERDGIPNVIMEALLHRLPVVASELPAIKEIIINKKTGLLVPPGKPQALAEAIMNMAGNREEALRMARAGREIINNLFDPQRNHHQVAMLFEKVVGSQ